MAAGREIGAESPGARESFQPAENTRTSELSLLALAGTATDKGIGAQDMQPRGELASSLTLTNVYKSLGISTDSLADLGVNRQTSGKTALETTAFDASRINHAAPGSLDDEGRIRRRYARYTAVAVEREDEEKKKAGATGSSARADAGPALPAGSAFKSALEKNGETHDAWDPAFDPLRNADHRQKLEMMPKYTQQAAMFDLVNKLEQMASAGRIGSIEELALTGAEVALLAVIVTSACRRDMACPEMQKPEVQLEAPKAKDTLQRRSDLPVHKVLQHLAKQPWLDKFLKNTFSAAQDKLQTQPDVDQNAARHASKEVMNNPKQSALHTSERIFRQRLDRAAREQRDATSLADDGQKLADKVLMRPMWLVRPDEDLVRLAEQLFFDGTMGWLIAQINEGCTKQVEMDGKLIVELRVRQRIEIPVWQDIVRFRKEGGHMKDTQRLVTVVTQSTVDRQLVDSTLAAAMGAL